MVTTKQLLKKVRYKKTKKKQSLALNGSPQKKAMCLKVYVTNPKKPNSAERKVAKVRLSTNKVMTGYIPGEGHNLQQHSIVLVQGGKTKDLPGVNYKFVRGVFDLPNI
uniref:ribosomal protein S12 n=1 Tax=Bostrychia tenuissima TaxID=196631 RepID=UPI002E795E7E|nr:ribosomal protein S12 [Bostrychia tenuissima]WQF69451.1 ribosomal protein S12 [Bostrychia tenuissima]